jgi:hypothetical protein
MASQKPKRTKLPAQEPPAATRASAGQRPSGQLPPRRKMPVWLQNTLVGLIVFTVTLGLGIIVQWVICALALGVAVFQLWNRRGRWLWTWLCFLAVALYVLGVYLALRHELAWFLYFGAWIFVIVALVGEGSRAVRRKPGASAD